MNKTNLVVNVTIVIMIVVVTLVTKTVAAVMRKTTSVTIKRHQTATVSHKSASQSKSVVSVTNVMTAMNVQKPSVQNVKIVVINEMKVKRLNCLSKVAN
ncbi:Uncharacterised protein [Vibrio cholerae]|nr:Uncharacterised protein [Vibrio cholerae]CSI43371.1 Uncharacterised protein [Vibrio cholerae]